MNHQKPKIKTVCCSCGDLICAGPRIDGKVSHECCKKCVTTIMANIKRGKYD